MLLVGEQSCRPRVQENYQEQKERGRDMSPIVLQVDKPFSLGQISSYDRSEDGEMCCTYGFSSRDYIVTILMRDVDVLRSFSLSVIVLMYQLFECVSRNMTIRFA